MFRKILMPVMLGTAMTVAGAAFADNMKTNVHKEAQTKTNAAVTDKSANPDAKLNKKLYKESQSKANAQVMDKKVSPDAKINKKLYKESQESARPGGMKKTDK